MDDEIGEELEATRVDSVPIPEVTMDPDPQESARRDGVVALVALGIPEATARAIVGLDEGQTMEKNNE